MSQNKSLQSKMPLAMGLAFVAFTTQFGGGFASGAQIYQYFINYGIWCLILPAVTQGLYALFFWYGMRYAYKHKTYDYRSFSDSLYGKTKPVMSNLYEICYLIMIGTASAAAFATGGSTLQTLFGIPYWLCTVIIAVFIFVIALFGTNVVRKCASTLSVLIIIGLLGLAVEHQIHLCRLLASDVKFHRLPAHRHAEKVRIVGVHELLVAHRRQQPALDCGRFGGEAIKEECLILDIHVVKAPLPASGVLRQDIAVLTGNRGRCHIHLRRIIHAGAGQIEQELFAVPARKREVIPAEPPSRLKR